MIILGINAAFHDSAACIMKDGQLIAAAEEERFTRIKHGKRPSPFSAYELPYYAIAYCLQEAGVKLKDVDHIGYSFQPSLVGGHVVGTKQFVLPLEPSAHPKPDEWEHVWEPLLVSSIVNAPRHLVGGVPHHLATSFSDISAQGPFQWHFLPHHLCHAASAYYPSPFEEAAVMCLDGRGERSSTSYSLGKGDDLHMLSEIKIPHSLGLLYEDVTSHLGFLRSSDEYKVMALASFGKPRYLSRFRDMVTYTGEGKYEIDSVPLSEWFGPPRRRGEPLEDRHFDVASSLQKVLEETVLQLCDWLHETTRQDSLCLAGGVALNCVMNARIRDESPFKDVWVQPAAGDAGTALGAAMWLDALNNSSGSEHYHMDHVYLGPSYSDPEIERFLDEAKLAYRKSDHIAAATASLLADDQIIGWFQGRMEFGPRALGSRSILASPCSADMQQRLNQIKDREDFRPVAPAVLAEHAQEWFGCAKPSPFMLFIHDVLPTRAAQIPAVCHEDGTARVQTVSRAQNALYYDTIEEFYRLTGVPVVVNTSFNTRGQPVVCSPRDAVESFFSSPLDALVIGSFIIEKQKRGSVHVA